MGGRRVIPDSVVKTFLHGKYLESFWEFLKLKTNWFRTTDLVNSAESLIV
jgi:hypothetical protein